MADISRITLPGGSAYDLKDAVRGVEFIKGTQTAATGSWTGVTTRAALFDGMQIKYFLPYAGSGNATLNLTLSGGGTTGAKPVYRWGTTYATTHYKANSVVDLTYSTKAVGTGAWYVSSQYDDGNTTALGSMTGTLGVNHGGTGATTLASGEALIGNGTDAVTTRAIRNYSGSADNIGWTSAGASIELLTQNDIAYWNGRYNSSKSNLAYCNKGAFGDAATYAVETTVANDAKLPTGAAVKSFVEGKGYVTTDTKNTAGSTDTSSKIFLIGATSQAANPQTYSDNEVYATSGVLTTKAVQVGGTKATMQFNSTTNALDFIFS